MKIVWKNKKNFMQNVEKSEDIFLTADAQT